jgi:hypothetical protein
MSLVFPESDLLPEEPIACGGGCGETITVPLMNIGIVVPVINNKEGWKYWSDHAFCPECLVRVQAKHKAELDAWQAKQWEWLRANPIPNGQANLTPWRIGK